VIGAQLDAYAQRPPCGGIPIYNAHAFVLPQPAAGTLVFGACRARSPMPDPGDYELGVVVGPAHGYPDHVEIVWGRVEKSSEGQPVGIMALVGGGTPSKEGWGRDYVHVWRRLIVVGHATIDGTAEELVVEWCPDASTPPCFYSDGEARTLAERARQLFVDRRSLGRGVKRQRAQADAAATAPPQKAFALVPYCSSGGPSADRGDGVIGETPEVCCSRGGSHDPDDEAVDDEAVDDEAVDDEAVDDEGSSWPPIGCRVVVGKPGPWADQLGVVRAKHNGYIKVRI
jgi:hypothetical protein